MPHVSMGHVTHVNESFCTYIQANCSSDHVAQRVTSHVNESCHMWMSHVTHVNASYRTYTQANLPSRHVSYWCVMSRINVHSHQTNAWCHIWTSHTACATWLIQTFDMNHSHHTNAWCHIWTSHTACEWFMSNVSMSHGAHIHTQSRRAVMSHHESCYIWMSHITHVNESCRTHTQAN